ncbi:MAG: hypothetical protein ABJA94_08335 [Rhodoglobus sp.]
MILKLDPRHPVVWRTPNSLQVGIDPALVTLDAVTEMQERLLAALVVGVSEPGLTMIAQGDAAARDAVITALSPALERRGHASVRTVAIVGVGSLVDALAHALGGSGVHVEVAADARALSDERPDLAVLAHHFVTPPALHGIWLRRDVPHLPVVFSDGGVRIGPMVEPGTGPCLLCLELYSRDADPAWPAIATQLLGRRAWAERPALVLDAAGLACRLVLEHLDGSAGSAASPGSVACTGSAASPGSVACTGSAASTRIDAETGQRETTIWLPHPECGCRGIDHLVTVPADFGREPTNAGRRGSGWAGAALDPVLR